MVFQNRLCVFLMNKSNFALRVADVASNTEYNPMEMNGKWQEQSENWCKNSSASLGLTLSNS